MKKIFATAIMVAFFLIPQMAISDTVTTVGDPSGYGPYQYDRGGEFTLQVDAGLSYLLNGYVSGTSSNVLGSTDTFQSFCIEGNEGISPNTTYFAELNYYGAANGGQSGQTSDHFDPISVGTAYLYREFITGNLSNYLGAGPGTYYETYRTTSANLLQQAFWWLEGEMGQVYSTNNYYESLVVSQYGSQTLAKANNNGQIAVGVLNLYQINSAGEKVNAQDQLVGVPVPEPGTMLLLGFGLIGLAGVRKCIIKS